MPGEEASRSFRNEPFCEGKRGRTGPGAPAGAPVSPGRRASSSFGVAASDARGFDYDAVFAQADLALYQAKSSDRDRVCSPGSRAHADAV
jgi:GGDEF domain-containing protein